jgi:hypothetical protein
VIIYIIFTLVALIDLMKTEIKPIIKMIWILSFFFAPFGFLFYYYIGKNQDKIDSEENL